MPIRCIPQWIVIYPWTRIIIKTRYWMHLRFGVEVCIPQRCRLCFLCGVRKHLPTPSWNCTSITWSSWSILIWFWFTHFYYQVPVVEASRYLKSKNETNKQTYKLIAKSWFRPGLAKQLGGITRLVIAAVIEMRSGDVWCMSTSAISADAKFWNFKDPNLEIKHL